MRDSVGAQTAKFPQSREVVWEASLKALAQYPKRDLRVGEGLILTDWVYGYADRPQGLVFPNQESRRERFSISIQPVLEGTEVIIRSQAEERPTRGTASLHWLRARPSPEAVEYLLSQIRKALK